MFPCLSFVLEVTVRIHIDRISKTYMQLKHWYQFLCNIPICARSKLIELLILFGWLTLKFLTKQCYIYAYDHRSPQKLFKKQEAHGPHRSPEKTIPYNIPFCSICYFHFKLWVLFWGTSIGPLFMNGFNSIESTLVDDPCIVISQTVTVLLLKKKKSIYFYVKL